MELVYSKNRFNLIKMFVLTANQAECSELGQSPIFQFLVADKCKPCEIYRWMFNVYGEAWFGGVLLFIWFLWYINFCRLFNAEFIFIQIISSISNCEIRSTPSLPSLQDPLWPRTIAPDRVLFMGQIELFGIWTILKIELFICITMNLGIK